MTDQNQEIRETAQEWRIAMFVVAGGLLIAIGVAAWFALRPVPQVPVAAQAPAMTTAQRHALALKVGHVLCDIEIADAKSIGIVPSYGKSASLPLRTSAKGRYACIASTGVAKYAVQADVLCGTLLDPRCVSVFSVTSDDGTVLFKRPDVKPAAK